MYGLQWAGVDAASGGGVADVGHGGACGRDTGDVGGKAAGSKLIGKPVGHVATAEVDERAPGPVGEVGNAGADSSTRPMTDFDERDLVDWAVTVGFEAVELDYRAQVDVPAEPIADWETLKCVAPNPLVPTYGEAIAAALNDEERERLDTHMNALAATGTPTRRTMATAFLRALRP